MCANHEHHLGACKNLTVVGGPGRVRTNVYTKASEQEESPVIWAEPDREGESLCVLTPEQKLRINPPPCFSPREKRSRVRQWIQRARVLKQ